MIRFVFLCICLIPSIACSACSFDEHAFVAAQPLGLAAATASAAGDRASWVITEIESFNAHLSPDDREAKYCKMVVSPFSFYRGTNHLFWHDHAGDPRFDDFGGAPSTRIWLQGDLHARNYGAYDNDEEVVVYDLNDFDETVIADYQWDVWRMAVSLELVADENAVFSAADIDDFLDSFSESYLDTVASYRGNSGELGTIFTKSNSYGLLDDFLIDVEDDNSRTEMLDRWTLLQDGARVFDLALSDLAPADPAVRAAIADQMPGYVATTAGDLAGIDGYFDIKDVAKRLDAGTGSLGTPRYYVLIEGASGSEDDDRILDVKRQGQPTPYLYLSAGERAQLDAVTLNHAERTILGYRALVAKADDHLGWMTLSDGVYSVRERSPYKEAFPTDTLDTEVRFGKLAEQWGAILATDHARADKDYRSDIIDYSFDKEVDLRTDGSHSLFRALVREIAHDYAQQVYADYAAFADYVAGGYACN